MELRVLRYFLAVAREENITKAAALLHLTQPTLSRQLMQLEEELGVQLFYRSRYHIVLTDEGMLLRRRAQELVDLADKTVREFSSRETELMGEIAIGAGETRNMSFLSQAIVTFRERYPKVSFRIFSANADDVKERLDMGLLDMGLLTGPVDVGKYAFCRMEEKDRWGGIGTGGFPIGSAGGSYPRRFERGSSADQRTGNSAAGIGQLVWRVLGQIADCSHLQLGHQCGQYGALWRGDGTVF